MAERPTYEELEKRVAELERQVEQFDSEDSKYRILFNSFPHGITVTDEHGNIVETNAVAEQLLGVNKAEHEKRKVDGEQWRIIRSDGSDMPPNEWASVIALEERRVVPNCEMGIYKSNDEITWLNVTAAPIPSKNNGVVITYNDVTEKRQAEKELAESEFRFRQFFENNGFYGYLISPDGIIVDVNRAAIEALEYKKDELVGSPLSEIYAEESLDEAKRIFQKWKREGKIRNAELVIKGKNGSKKWVLLNVDSVTDNEGNIIHSTSIQVDITDRKAAEKRLEKSELLHRTTIGNISDAVMITDDDGNFTYLCPNTDLIFGLKPEQILEHGNISILFEHSIFNADELNKNKELTNIEVSILDSKGKEHSLLVNVKKVAIADGKILYTCRDITEKIAAEKKLKESEQKYRELFISNTDGIIRTDLDGVINEVNPTFLNMVGYNDISDLRKTYQELTPEKWHALEDDIVRDQVFKRGYSDEYEKEYVHKDGTVFPISIKVWLVEDQGKPVGMWGIVRDITERKEAEKAIIESEDKFKGIFEYSNIGIALGDEQGDLIDVNEEFVKLLGYSKQELLEMNFSQLTHPDDLENELVFLSKLTKREIDNYRIEKRYILKNEEIRWVDLSVTARRNYSGEIVMFIGMLMDITYRKKAEEALKKSKQELQRTLEATTDGIWTWNFVSNELSFSPKYYTMLGYEPYEFPANYDSWSSLVHPEDREKAIAIASEYLKTKPDVYLNEFRLKTKSGDYRWIRAQARVVDRDNNDEALYIIGNHEDITERKTHETILQESEQKTKSILNAIPDMMFILSSDGKMLDFMAHNENELYRSPNKIVGQNIKDDMPFEFVDTCMHYIEKTLDTGKLNCFEYKLPFPDEIKDYEARLAPYGVDKVLAIVRNITDRKSAEKALKESEERFRLLIEAGPIAIFLLRDGKYIYSNPAAARMLGYENSTDICGVSALQTISPEFREAIMQRMKRIDAGKSNEPIELKFVKKNGGLTWTLSTSVSVILEGKPTAIIMGQDITDLKKAEQKLNDAETMQVALAEHLPAGMMLVDASTRKIESVNVYAASLFGDSIDNIIGHKCHKYICTATEGECPVCDLDQKIDNAEREIVLKDGSRLPVLKSVVSLTLDGKVKLLEYFIDISDRKKAEIELRKSEEKYRRLVNTAPYGIQLTDREGKIIFSNPAHHKIQGYAEGQLIGKYIWELMADENHRSKAKGYYQKLIKEQRTPEVYYNRDLTKDGREIDVQVNWDYLKDSEGRVEGIISIISDITKQKALESSIQQAQKMESIGNLAGGIAHDFNNILFPIVGMSEMLLEDLPIGSGERENAEEIFKAGKRGGDLVKQILAFSRQSEHKKIPTRIQNVLKEVIKLSRATIPTYIEIKQDIQQDCGMVMADPTQIHQIAMNIITNAYHSMEDEGGKLTLQLKQVGLNDSDCAEKNLYPGNYALLSISDTGHGISNELISKIFEPYFTTKEQGKGTGLGLAVVYGIVREHGGNIKVNSEIGQGSTFDIYFPLMKKTNSVEAIPEVEAYKGGKERILLVDDEEPIAKLEKQMLERLGYSVTSRISGVDALEAFKASPSSYDLVMTDMSMPNMPGDKLAREIKAIRSDVPIIICTGFSERIHEDNFRGMGIDGLLMKPVVKSELLKMVRKILDKER